MSEIREILEEAHRQARDLDNHNDRGELAFWRFVRTYSEVALDLAYQLDPLAWLPAPAVFSPLVLRRPRLRAFLAPYDLHRYLYLDALAGGRPPTPLEVVRAADAVIHQIFLGFPEPGYRAFPGMLHYLDAPEEGLEDVRLQESFILRRLDLSRAEAAERLASLERSLRNLLPQAAQQPTRGGALPPRVRDLPTRPTGGYQETSDEVDATPRSYGLPVGEPKEAEDIPAPPRGPMGSEVPPPPAPHEDGHLYRVWYATTRRPVDEASAQSGYAPEADPRERIHHGYCDVLIPRSHKFGSVGSPGWKRWLRPWRQDDRLRIEQYARLEEAIFLNQIRREFANLDPEERVALVYIHGYRTSFDEAAVRAAQIGFDLKIPGVTAFFSWHSRGELDDYLTDREAIQEAEPALRRFLLQFARDVDAEKVHLLAHSMGNQGLARVVQDIAEEVTEETGKPFAQIVLAAPDIGQRLFRRLAKAYPQVSERTTLYVSAKDKALKLSRWLQDTDRVGFTPPVTVVDEIDTVEVTNIDLTILGHGYFAAAAPVLYDIAELLHDGKPPERRLRLQEVAGPPRHWAIGR